MPTELTEFEFDELLSEWSLVHADSTRAQRKELEVGIGRQAFKVTRYYVIDLLPPVVYYEGTDKMVALAIYNGIGLGD